MLGELEAVFPGFEQVKREDLSTADDQTIWQYAKDCGFAVVTQDSDFHELATLYGAPPKIIWLKCGNRSRWYVQGLLLREQTRIERFGDDLDSAVVELY